ncbi:MAG: dihydrolipoyl dehydrogenase [Alphaproteobacteria bacterium]
MAEQAYDVIVVGAGPGGYVAAIRASQLGKKTAIVEGEHLGGICLNWGCIPTKALLRSAEVYDYMNHAEAFGLKVEKASFDLDKVIKRSRGVADQLSSGIKHLMKKNKIDVHTGYGQLTGKKADKHALTVKDAKGKMTTLLAKNIILATGARARELPHLKADGDLIWTYKHAMTPKKMPKKLLVVGSGAIGVEFASFYRSMGAEVTIVEIMDRILPVEDKEISTMARKAFEKRGVSIMTETSVEKLVTKGKKVEAELKDKKGKASKDSFDNVILAVGIQGNVENIGLDSTGIKTDKGHIVTNEWCETAEKGIYAIGDVTGAPWLAHKASHEGVLAVEHLCGEKGLHPMKKESIPGCTYSNPQVASVGLTEEKAKEAGHEIKVGRFPFQGNGKAIALGEPEGLIKTVFDAKTGELLGAHMIGAEVTELIQGYAIAKSLETTEQELMHTIFPHPTLSEMMHESVLDAYDKVIHM